MLLPVAVGTLTVTPSLKIFDSLLGSPKKGMLQVSLAIQHASK